MKATKRHLIGRRIVAVDFRKQWDKDRRQWYTNPRITLDNGRTLFFVTQELDTGDYGTQIAVTEPLRKK
jgi:hypothetical protein